MDKSLKSILVQVSNEAPELLEPKNFNQLVNVCRASGFWGREDSIRRSIPEVKDKASTTKSKMMEAEQSGLLTFKKQHG